MKQQILVMHGAGAFAGIAQENLISAIQSRTFDVASLRRRDDWKATLQEKLGADYDCLFPRMPHADQPHYDVWKAVFEKIVPILDNEVIYIGHSLGGLFLLKYFSENTLSKKIKGLFSVAAPFGAIEGKWKDAGFVLGPDLSLLQNILPLFLYYSEDDPLVPFSSLAQYQEKIPHAEVRALTGRGHFRDDNLPEIVSDIKNLLPNT